ncbi:MAG: PD-(D/E)XK nuclease family protein [Clostridia bacterium]|nr:PD-(D/E)XK nuclease family protein [Clostridia bacterium]
MNLNIVLGVGKSGKSKYIYDEIDEKIKMNKSAVLFVPSQLRMLAEENYMRLQKKEGIIGFDITTLSEFVSDYLNLYKLTSNDNYISKLDRKLILTKLITENPNIFNIFSKVKNSSGFIDMLDIYMDIFKKEDIDIEKLSDIILKDKILEYKLKEIIEVYKKYTEVTNEKYVDSVDETTLFLKEISKSTSNLNKDLAIFFDGYNNFSQSELKVIDTFLRLGIDVTISINTNITPEDNINEQIALGGIFSTSNLTYLKLTILGKKNGANINIKTLYDNYLDTSKDIKHIAKNIFVNEMLPKVLATNIEINLTSNMYTEIESIVKIIDKKVKEGYRYNDFVIYTSNVEDYSHIIRKIMYKYNQPVYINEKYSMDTNILVVYIKKMIGIVSTGFDNEMIFELLKTGLTDIPYEDICYIENYVLEFNVNKYSWNKEFNLNNSKKDLVIYDVEKINLIRKQILNVFGELINIGNKKISVKSLIQKIYDNLINNNILLNYEKHINDMLASADPELIYLSQIYEQVWEKLCEVFDSIIKIYEETNITVKMFRDIFEYSSKCVELKSVPPTLDNISVLDINSNKCEPKKYMFLVSVNENKLPLKVDEDVFFSDLELSKLDSQNIIFKQNSISKINMELYNIYEAFNNVTEKLYLFIPVSDLMGKSLRKSSIIENITQLVDVEINGNITSTDEIDMDFNEISTVNDAFMYMSRETIKLEEHDNFKNENTLEKASKILAVYKYLNSNLDNKTKEYVDILKYYKNDGNLNINTIGKLYGNDLKTSVSKLELFKKCPFSYYMNYGLNLKPRKIYSISSMDIGSFMHSVIEQFSLYLFQNSVKWHELLITNDNTTKHLKVLDNIIIDELDVSFKNHKDSIKYNIIMRKLKNTLNKVVLTIAKSFNQSEFEPYGYEIEFREGKLFAPIIIKLDDSKSMQLVGKIDRIDTLKIEDKLYTRIVDYKSSSKDLSLDDIKEGISLQLVTYLDAFMQNIEKKENVEVIPAGMLYFNLSDNLVSLKNYTKDNSDIEKEVIKSLRMKGIFLKDAEVINKMDNKVTTDERLIDVSIRTINSDSSKKVLEEQEFKKLCNDINNILKQIGNEILSGKVKIEPLKKKEVCKYCNYSSICRKDICI